MKDKQTIRGKTSKEEFDFSQFSYNRLIEINLIYAFPFAICMGLGIVANCMPIFYSETWSFEVLGLNLAFYVLFVFSIVPVLGENMKNRFFGSPIQLVVYIILLIAYLVSAFLTSYFTSELVLVNDVYQANTNIIPFILIVTPIALLLLLLFYVFMLRPMHTAMSEISRGNCTASAIECLSYAISFAKENDKEIGMAHLSFEVDEEEELVIYNVAGGHKEPVDLKKALAGHMVELGNLSVGLSNFKRGNKIEILRDLNKRFGRR